VELWTSAWTRPWGTSCLSRDAHALLVARPRPFHREVAQGLCDDLLSSVALARQRESCRLLVARR